MIKMVDKETPETDPEATPVTDPKRKAADIITVIAEEILIEEGIQVLHIREVVRRVVIHPLPEDESKKDGSLYSCIYKYMYVCVYMCIEPEEYSHLFVSFIRELNHCAQSITSYTLYDIIML